MQKVIRGEVKTNFQFATMKGSTTVIVWAKDIVAAAEKLGVSINDVYEY